MVTSTAPATENAGLDDTALRVREEIARRRLSRQAVAAKAGISLSTLEKALAGRRPFTLATIVRLETVFGIALRSTTPAGNGVAGPATGVASDDLGSYSRGAVSWLEGPHLTVRPSFSDSRAVYAYRTDITWDDRQNCLTFREAERIDTDFTQFGTVAVPHQSGHIYLVTNRHGQHRLIVVARPTISGEMHGILTTLQARRGSHLAPVATPIVLKPIGKADAPAFGKITPASEYYASYARLLRRTLQEDYAALLTP